MSRLKVFLEMNGYTLEDAAKITGYSLRSVHHHCQHGILNLKIADFYCKKFMVNDRRVFLEPRKYRKMEALWGHD